MSIERRAFQHALMAMTDPQKVLQIMDQWIAPDATFHVAHPINEAVGLDGIFQRFLQPLNAAMPGRVRRDDIFMAGTSRTGSGEWVAAMGHYTSNLIAPLFGIQPTNKLVFLRYGEFYRLAEGRILEARILLDLPDLMRQAGHVPHATLPLLHALGTEMLFPAPASHDGVMLDDNDVEQGERSASLVEAMLSDLRAYDPATFQSANQTGTGGYWHQNMLWYGPGGIGSNMTYPGFDKDHRVPFLKGFPDRIGGNHYARFGDGDFVASGGWPSLTGTHDGDYLGIAATGRKIGMRVMDFWRCADDPNAGHQIMENWVFIDMPDLYRQLGVELFEAF